MRHARRSYQTIQDSSGRIPDDEPVFVLRAKDRVAPVVLRIYADLVRAAGGDAKFIETCELWSRQMETYAFSVYGGGKVPDAPIHDYITTPEVLEVTTKHSGSYPATEKVHLSQEELAKMKKSGANRVTSASVAIDTGGTTCTDCEAAIGELHDPACVNFVKPSTKK